MHISVANKLLKQCFFAPTFLYLVEQNVYRFLPIYHLMMVYVMAPEYTGPRIGQLGSIMIQLMYVVHDWTVDYSYLRTRCVLLSCECSSDCLEPDLVLVYSPLFGNS